MEEKYPWLRLCEAHWKVDQLWVSYFSTWKRPRTAPNTCQADVTFSRDNLSHREQTEPMLQQYSDLESRWEEKTLYL